MYDGKDLLLPKCYYDNYVLKFMLPFELRFTFYSVFIIFALGNYNQISGLPLGFQAICIGG